MQPFIANTDKTWFRSFTGDSDQPRFVDETNFWQPNSTRRLAELAPGTPLFFRLKKPDSCIAGYGFYAHCVSLKLRQAWEFFGAANGAPDLHSFLQILSKYRGLDLLTVPPSDWAPIGCTVLRDCVFWPQSRWLPWSSEAGWAPNIVQGKRERDETRASRLLAEIAFDAMTAPEDLSPEPFQPFEVDERELVMCRHRERKGQGTFRSRLLDAYGRRCAITGEHTEVVLDAAHIQPYLGTRSNHVQNGLLLTKEFHALFDEGYATVTPDYRVSISGRLRDEWENGHRYYPFDGKRLEVIPSTSLCPSPAALDWHMRRVFRA